MEHTIAQVENFAVVIEPEEDQEPEDAVPFLTAVSSTGLKLRDAGQTKEQIERTAWLFGFDLQRLPLISTQTRVWNSDLADVLDSIGRST